MNNQDQQPKATKEQRKIALTKIVKSIQEKEKEKLDEVALNSTSKKSIKNDIF